MVSPTRDREDGEYFTVYRLTENGVAWLFENKAMLTLKVVTDEDIPF